MIITLQYGCMLVITMDETYHPTLDGIDWFVMEMKSDSSGECDLEHCQYRCKGMITKVELT